MLKKFENGIVFKNGNVNFRFTNIDIDIINDNSLYPYTDDFTQFQNCLEWIDIYLTGEENYYYNDQSWIAYSFNNQKEYEIYSSDIKKLMKGKTVKLYARKASEETMARMEER